MKIYISLPWIKYPSDDWQLRLIKDAKASLKFYYTDDIEFYDFWSIYKDQDENKLNRDSVESLEKCLEYIKLCDKVIFLTSYDDTESSESKIEMEIVEHLFPDKFISNHTITRHIADYHHYMIEKRIVKVGTVMRTIESLNETISCYGMINEKLYPINQLIVNQKDSRLIFSTKNEEENE